MAGYDSAFMEVDHGLNCALFETYVQTQLAPTLRAGDVVILDNLSCHKSKKDKATIKERGT